MANHQNYYSNPAFCQQSEFYNQRALSPKALSPVRNVRQPPVGAQTPLRILDTSIPDQNNHQDEEDYEEQEFYEEMLVDDTGIIKEKKVLVVAQNHNGNKYIQIPQNDSRYGVVPLQNRPQINPEVNRNQKPTSKHRYEYIPMQDSTETIQRVHRYAVIDTKEETELTRNGRYALVPVEDLNMIRTPNKNRYEYIQESPNKPSPPQNRYEYITTPQKPSQPSQQRPRGGNPVATQKLHELLSTPKKTQSNSKPNTPQKMLSPQAMRRPQPPISPIPKVTPQKTVRPINPKAQQKLNYTIGTRQNPQDKRNTAIVPPMCSSPIQSVYSETTYSNKSGSWLNISSSKGSGYAVLTVSAIMMLLCGGVTSGLCFYMISIMGRLYYLDMGLVAGFTCLILGLLGFRSRNVYWLPNRNYITGYIVLSFFSLLTCAGLLVLLFMRPKPGTPLADMTSGAVCGISGFSLLIAVIGVFSSYCCTYPPPDNRVQHCVQGFTV